MLKKREVVGGRHMLLIHFAEFCLLAYLSLLHCGVQLTDTSVSSEAPAFEVIDGGPGDALAFPFITDRPPSLSLPLPLSGRRRRQGRLAIASVMCLFLASLREARGVGEIKVFASLGRAAY